MKVLSITILFLFMSFQTFSQDEESSTTTKKSTSSDIATKIASKINACSDTDCFVTFYNKMAKVCLGFKNEESGKQIIAEILKLIDKKEDGVLFDVYMSKNNVYRQYFIKCAKLLPNDLQVEIQDKAKKYLKKNK